MPGKASLFLPNTFDINTDHLRILEETDLLDDEDNLNDHDEEVMDSFDEDYKKPLTKSKQLSNILPPINTNINGFQ